MTRRSPVVYALAVFVHACAPADPCEAPCLDGSVVVHEHQNPTTGFVNQFLVETETGIVAVDGGFLASDVDVIEARIDSIGKPLRAILLTHAHLDHTMGLARLSRDGEVPVYAAHRTIREHETHDYASRLPNLSSLYPEGEPTFTAVRSGFALTDGGVEFSLREMGPGESEWDVVWTARGTGPERVFVGDLLLHQVHGFFQAGRSFEWTASLEDLIGALPADAVVYAGHGPAETGIDGLKWQVDYIERIRSEVRSLTHGVDSLDADQEAALFAEVASWLPANRLEFLIPLGGDVLAAELSLEDERRRIDEKLDAPSGG